MARLAAALAPLHARLERLEGEVVKADGEILRLQDVVANVNHAFGTKPWPDLFDPFVTDKIARRAFRLGNLLTPATADGHRKVRIGHRYDGGYVAAAPTDVPGIEWHCNGIGPHDTEDLRSLRSIVQLAGFSEDGDLVLKIDAELAEWEALQTEEAAPLDRFRQMVIEFHWFDRIADDVWFATARRAFERIWRSHAPVHVHANNGVGMMLLGGVSFPRVLEVTFARKDVYA